MGGGETLKEGYLTKSPPNKSKKWRKRWFQLRSSRILEYRRSPEGSLKGVVNLEDCITVHMTLSHKKYKHVFGVETRSRLYFLVAPSEEEMKEWVEAITFMCGLVMVEGATQVSKGTTNESAGVVRVPLEPVHNAESTTLAGNKFPDQGSAEALPPVARTSFPKNTPLELPQQESITHRLPSSVAIATDDPTCHYDQVHSKNASPSQGRVAPFQGKALVQESRLGQEVEYDIPRMALEATGYQTPRKRAPVKPLQGGQPLPSSEVPAPHGTNVSKPTKPVKTPPHTSTSNSSSGVYSVPRGLPNHASNRSEGGVPKNHASSREGGGVTTNHTSSREEEPSSTIRFEDVELPLPQMGGDGQNEEPPEYMNLLRTPYKATPTSFPTMPPVDRTSKPQTTLGANSDLKPGGTGGGGIQRLSLADCEGAGDSDLPTMSDKTVAYTLITFDPATRLPVWGSSRGRGLPKAKVSNYAQVDIVATKVLEAKLTRQGSAPSGGSVRHKMVKRSATYKEESFDNDDDDDDGDGDEDGGGGGGGGSEMTQQHIRKDIYGDEEDQN